MRFFFFCFSAVFKVDCDFSTHDVHKIKYKRRKIKTVDVTFSLDVF